MANKENIIPHQFTSEQSREEAAKNGQKGGIASGESRRRKRELREIFEAVRDTPVDVVLPDNTKKSVGFDEAAVLAMFRKAMAGNVEAMKLIATMLGEYEQKVKVSGANPVLVTPDEMAALTKWAKGDDDDASL